MTLAPQPALLPGGPTPSGTRAHYAAGPAAPARTLVDVLTRTAQRHPDALAVDDGARPLTYGALLEEVEALRAVLAGHCVARGSRVGVRVPSGTADLYVCVLAALAAGAAYVPVDADDPDVRAREVFDEAGVAGVLGAGRAYAPRRTPPPAPHGPPAVPVAQGSPTPDDDAWVIFTSGSTGRPKGVAVTHRSAAAFVDAEARLFLQDAPLGPGDRVLAGLSVAFDASCEEMWLAWRHGACLVPAPRALVRSGPELGPWLARRRVTVVSTVPTLAALWPDRALDGVRLLVFGGEACPAELAARVAVPGREVWNTYGPTEATVVACAAPLTADGPVRIGLPLDGWELAVVDARGEVVPTGSTGELVIGGVGLARYLDPAKDAQRYAPLPSTGWHRAYRTGDLVRAERAGLVFLGRADDQVKLGGRRVELGEVDAALCALPGVAAGASAVRTTPAGTRVLVGYVLPETPAPADAAADSRTPLPPGAGTALSAFAPDRSVPSAGSGCRTASGAAPADGVTIPAVSTDPGTSAPEVPEVPDVPDVPDGPASRAGTQAPADATDADGPAEYQADAGPVPADPLAAGPASAPPAGDVLAFDRARALAALRERLPAALVPLLVVVDALPTRTSGKVDRDALPWPPPRQDAPDPARTATEAWLARQWNDLLGVAVTEPDADFFAHGGGSLAAAQLVSRIREQYGTGSVGDVYQHPTLGALAAALDARADAPGTAPAPPRTAVRPVPRTAQAVQLVLMLPLFTVAGLRWSVPAAAAANVIGVGPGFSWWGIVLGWLLVASPPGRIVLAAGGARLLLRGVRPGTYPRGGAVHLRLWTAERLADASGATNLAGAWLTYYARALGVRIGDGVDLHALPPVTGLLRLGRGAAVEPEVDLAGHWLEGDRLHVGSLRIGADAVVGARSTLFPGARIGKRAEVAPGSCVRGTVPAGERWSGVPATRVGRAGKAARRADRPPRRARWTFAYAVTSLLLGLLPALAALPALLVLRLGPGPLTAVPLAAVTGLVTYALLVLVGVRALGAGLREGSHPVHGAVAFRAWAVERLMDMARVHLFPLYASLATPGWLRALGMKVGRGVEASTVLALPAMTTVGDGAFLADDTMVAPYELGGGRLRLAAARVGKRAFLGNSGMAAAGRRVPKRGLVGVLSAAPKRAKAGSSWLGMPPIRLPRAAEEGDASRTYAPTRGLAWARAAVELCRLVPVVCAVGLAVFGVLAFAALAERYGTVAAAGLGGALLLAAGLVACLLAAAAKWLVAGRHGGARHPLWSAFVWRGELADTFVEVLAVPWLVGPTAGTPLTGLWLRAIGARVGRGVWCETHWLPEADLVSVGAGASVNRGCVLQTHLFHDRIMRLDRVVVGAGATLGPHGIALPGTVLGDRVVVGPASLVMRGERVPADTRWLGNPIAAWP
ncbi:Pls/PosA family non-ribosomal peptide synthetase [Streptomyces sp. NPDC047315]|uniref:Pls/PosA family non-ribosomal peptide synthetase n=1 Tax=Streptomyces sp. NPDC047315 TaxID=3155142 RepID=UPI0033DA1548